MAKKSNFLTLYHFTSMYHLEHEPILQEGLTVTDVPIGYDRSGQDAVWLTSDPNPANQAWGRGGEEVEIQIDGKKETAETLDKTEVRITLKFKLPNLFLKKWTVYAREKKVDRKWYRAMDKTGGGGSDNWWLFFGHIPAKDFVSIEVRQGDKYLPLDDNNMAELNNPLAKALANRDPVHLLRSKADRAPGFLIVGPR